MGYRITYENGVIRKETHHIRRIKWKRWGLGAISAAMVITLALPGGRLWVRNLILPGDEEVTATALEEMVENIRSGESVGQAVETFCREIIAGGA